MAESTSCSVSVVTKYGFSSGSYNNTLGSTTYNVTASNYASHTSEIESAGTTQGNTITDTAVYKLFNLSIPNSEATTHKAANGITYYIKTTYAQGSTTDSSNSITYTTVWGTSTSYGQTYQTSTDTFTTSTYTNAATTLTSDGATQRANCKAYLDTLIGTVTTPSTVSSSCTVSGVTFYYRTVFSGSNSSITATSCTLTATTSWGYSTSSYAYTYATSSTTVVASTYQSYNTDITSIGSTQRTNIVAMFNALKSNALLHFDSTTTKDECGGVWTAYGSPSLTTTNAKFNKALNLPSGSYIMMDQFLLGGQDFTIDGFVYFSSSSGNYSRIFDMAQTDANNTNCIVLDKSGSTTNWSLIIDGNTTTFAGTWNTLVHLAVVYNHSAKTSKIYVGGQLKGTISNKTIPRLVRKLRLGKSSYSGDGAFIGQIDEFRITDGVQRWTENFTPPTAAAAITVNNNVKLPATRTGSHEAANGITYYYKTTYSNDSEYVARYTTVWGTSTSYGQTYSNTTTTFTTSNVGSSQSTLTSNVDTIEGNLKTYLNTLIGTVTTPPTETETYVSSVNGNTYYIKTTYSGSNSSVTATTCTLTATTVWGTSTSYGQSYATSSTTVVASTYQSYNTDITSKGSTHRTNCKKYLDTLIGTVTTPSTETETYVSSVTGLTYYIKTTYSGSNSSVTATTCTITATTVWGRTTSYGQSYTSDTTTVKASTYQSYSSNATSQGSTQRTNCKSYLDTLISNSISAPSDKTVTFSTNSGKTFYVKTSYSGSSTATAVTSCTISYTTVYGLSNSYGNTLSSNKSFTITATNYKTWTSDLNTEAGTEQDKVKDLTSYKMLNISLPSPVSKTNYVASNGITYQYKTTYTQGNADLTKNSIIYTTTWGIGNYNQTYSTATETLTTSTYTNAATILSGDASTKHTALEDYLDKLINTVTAPSTETETYVSSVTGLTYYIKTTYSGSNSSITATTCTITATTVWGTSTSYGQSYTSGTTTVTASTYQSYNANATSQGSTQRTNCKNYLDTVFYNATLPSDKTTTFSTKSGKTFYVKTSYSGSITGIQSSATVTYATVYGLTNSYGQSYSSKSFTITPTNYKTWTSDLNTEAGTEQDKIKNLESYKLLNLTVPSGNSKTYKATNGNTYQYKWAYTQGNADLTSNTYLITVTWGIGNYNQTYETDTIVFTKSTDTTTYNETNIKAYFNTLIGNVAAPSESKATFATASGKSFYIKTSYSGGNSSITATSCTITATTVYGLTTSYGNTCSTDTLEITISNLSDRTSLLNSMTTTEQNKVKDLDSFKMLNVSLPNTYSENFTANNTTTYNLKTTYTQGNADLTSNTITLVSSYNNTNYETNTVVLNTTTYKVASTSFTDERSSQIQRLKDYLNTYLRIPEDYTTTYTKNGFNYALKLVFSLPSESSKNLNETAYVDNIQYSAASGQVGTYNTQSALDSAIDGKISEIIGNITNVLDTYSYPNLHDTYTKSGMSFNVDAKYTKEAGDTDIKLSKFIDDVSFEGTLTVYSITGNEFSSAINSFTNIDSVNAIAYMKLLLEEELPTGSSELHIVRDGIEFPMQLTYSKALGYSSPLVITVLCHNNQYSTKSINGINFNEFTKIGTIGDYMYHKVLSDINSSIPDDLDNTTNGIHIQKQYTKPANTTIVTCRLFMDNELIKTETAEYTSVNMYDTLNALCSIPQQTEEDIKSLDLSVNIEPVIIPATSISSSHSISVKTEKIGNKVRVYRLIDRLRTNYIDVTINYNDIPATELAVQEVAETLIETTPEINFKRLGGVQAAKYLLKTQIIA